MPAGDQALALAQLVDTLPNLKLRGMISYDGGAQHIKGFKTRLEQTLQRFEPSVETFERMKRSGLSTEIFSGGGTGTYNIMPKVAGVTDVQVGSYVFMDCQYIEIGGESDDEVFGDFAPSLTVMTTVLNTYFPGSLTTDAGAKALTLNKPGPWVIGEKGFAYNAGSDEFGVDPLRDGRTRLQGRRQARADRAALRPGGQRVRPDLRDPQGSRRGGLADRRTGTLTVVPRQRQRMARPQLVNW